MKTHYILITIICIVTSFVFINCCTDPAGVQYINYDEDLIGAWHYQDTIYFTENNEYERYFFGLHETGSWYTLGNIVFFEGIDDASGDEKLYSAHYYIRDYKKPRELVLSTYYNADNKPVIAEYEELRLE